MRLSLLPACLALVAACAPLDADTSTGVPRFSLGPHGPDLSTIDFGVVAMERRVERQVVVTNVGRGPLLLDGFTSESEGTPVQPGAGLVVPNAVFGVDLEPTELAPGASKTLTFFFLPPAGASMALVDHTVTLRTEARNVSPPAPRLELRGQAIRVECEVPTRLDFGPAARGESLELTETLENTLPIERLARVGELQSTHGPGVFALSTDSPRGDVTLAPGQRRALKFVFTPFEVRDFSARISIRRDAECPEVTMTLTGTGMDSVLSMTPGFVDFGFVEPGSTVTRELTFLNRSFQPVQLSGLSVREGSSPSSLYEVVAANPGDRTRLTVPSGARDPMTNDLIPGVAKVVVGFRPTVLGPRNATLVFTSSFRSQSQFTVPLRGFGGGPDIEVLPAPTLAFGPIAFTPGNPSSATRALVVRNIGTAPRFPDPRANLFLGAAGAGRPLFSVTPKNAESAVDEVCVGIFDALTGTCTNDLPSSGPDAYDPAVGLAASRSIEIPVRVQPKNPLVDATTGTKAWEVTVFSNDPDEPEVRIMVTAGPFN